MNARRLASAMVLVFSVTLIATGCGYKAHVRGIIGPDQVAPELSGAKFCVLRYPDAVAESDSDVNAVVAEKIQRLLADRGYEVTGQEDADFCVLYDYELKTLMHRVRIHPLSGTRSGIRTTKVEGPFDQTLALRLVDVATYRDKGMSEYIWAGGAVLDNIPTTSERFVDLLLVAGFRHFPEDTGEVVEMRLSLNDAEARRLRKSGWYPESDQE